MRQQTNMAKLKDTVRAIIDQCEPSELGQVKLHKALYYSDMLNYLATGESITGSSYKKRPFGPTNESLLFVLDELKQSGELEVREVDYFGYTKREFHKRNRPNISTLSEKEFEAIKEVVNFVCRQHSASTISDFSHDIVWESVEMGQDIPYHLALSWIPVNYSEDSQRWADKAARELADGRRSEASKMDGHPRRSLRERMESRT